ncbi:uncharacterized protein LOC119907221 isoform X2 [Micropterus salmoides]|nr:uncharacterized protein LOC119907221 isoform X2 [Micropterus salmoides]
MDPLAFTLLLFLLAFIGCCAGQSVLPSGPVDAIVGRNVTLTTLVDKANYDYITWNFNNGAQFNVATLSLSGLKVGTRFQGRASINTTNGYLTLTSLKAADGGEYSISILSSEGTQTGDIILRVLDPATSSTPTSASPETTKQCTGCCAGQSVLPSGPVDAIVGRNVTLTTLVDKANYDYITWNFNNGAQFNAATLSRSGLKVGTRFQGRASINTTNGYLTLTSLKAADGGEYSISILSSEGTQTGDIILRVLDPATSSTPTSASPETTKQCTDPATSSTPTSASPETTKQCTVYFVPLVVCVVLIVLLLAGYLLLLFKWMKNRNLRSSKSRNVELSGARKNRTPVSTGEDSTYQSLDPASRDKDQIYSSLT